MNKLVKIMMSLCLCSILFLIGGCKGSEDYKKDVERKGLQYSRASFMKEIAAGNKETVDLFIKAGIGVNDKDTNRIGMTPLMVAITNQRIEIVKLLLDNKADVNAKDSFGRTALIYAVNGKSYEYVTGAETHTTTSPSVEIVKLLIDRGADVNFVEPTTGMNMLFVAVYNNKTPEILKMLIAKGVDVKAKDKKGKTVLMAAADSGMVDMAKILIDSGADLNAKDQAGYTALMLACLLDDKETADGRLDVVKLLVDNGADVNAKDNTGGTALGNAAFAGNSDMAKILIDKGADLNAKGGGGLTPLMLACTETKSKSRAAGQEKVVKLLIDKGADVNARSNNNTTALRAAIAWQRIYLVEMLKKAGAKK